MRDLGKLVKERTYRMFIIFCSNIDFKVEENGFQEKEDKKNKKNYRDGIWSKEFDQRQNESNSNRF